MVSWLIPHGILFLKRLEAGDERLFLEGLTFSDIRVIGDLSIGEMKGGDICRLKLAYKTFHYRRRIRNEKQKFIIDVCEFNDRYCIN
jgi:hypothetical protein